MCSPGFKPLLSNGSTLGDATSWTLAAYSMEGKSDRHLINTKQIMSQVGLLDWLRGPYWPPSIGVLTSGVSLPLPGVRVGYVDHTGCHQNGVLTAR
jgi:hypothetical protein